MKLPMTFFAFTLCLVSSVQAQVDLTVPGNRVITLAGQPAGTRSVNNARSAPGDSPVPVNLTLVPGEALFITATGAVDSAGPDGRTTCNDSVSAEFAVARVVGSCRALLGVFLADSTRPQPAAGLDFTGDARNHPVLRPLLQQPFFIGAGITPTGQRKAFVVPPGATRLFLAPLGNPNSTGAFAATVARGSLPEVPDNPLRVSAVTALTLAGQTAGTLSANGARTASVYAPPQVGVPLVPGQILRIVATGSADSTGPDGRAGCTDNFRAEFAISSIDARCRALAGVFLADSTRAQPPNVNYTGATRNTVRVEPLIQQPFLIGSGYTDSGELKQFVVPAGATRLYLASVANINTPGSFLVTVSPEAITTPDVTRSGLLRAAGFSDGTPAPGSLASIFGSSLADTTTAASSVPLPIQLGSTRVYFNLHPAPFFFASNGQVNVQVPWELAGETSAQLVVVRNGAASMPVPVGLAPVSPGIFVYREGAGVIVNGASGQLVEPQTPNAIGDTLVIYASGLGPIQGAATTGAPASTSVLEPTEQPVQALLTVDGQTIQMQVLFAGSAPGFIGVNQVNAVIPAGTPAGAARLKLRTRGIDSNEVNLTLQR